MNNPSIRIIGIACFLLLFFRPLCAQNWELVKERDGIKIYTRKEAGKSLKSYKGVANVRASADRVLALLEDANHTGWWDKNINQIRVIQYEKNKKAQYYMVYDLPWPVGDRDLCVDATVTIDPVTGISQITSVPLPSCVPEKKDVIRIREYKQTWTVKPQGKELCQVTLEGYLDPSGTIPDWISNMLIVDSPLKVIESVRNALKWK